MSKEKKCLCDSCQHEKMCKFKTDFIIAETVLQEKEADVNKKFKEDDLIKVEINCKFYSMLDDIFTKKPIDISLSPLTPPYTLADPCASCEWHKSMLTRTTPYIGDSPCEWCVNNKFKATWNTPSISTNSSSSISTEKDMCEAHNILSKTNSVFK